MNVSACIQLLSVKPKGNRRGNKYKIQVKLDIVKAKPVSVVTYAPCCQQASNIQIQQVLTVESSAFVHVAMTPWGVSSQIASTYCLSWRQSASVEDQQSCFSTKGISSLTSRKGKVRTFSAEAAMVPRLHTVLSSYQTPVQLSRAGKANAAHQPAAIPIRASVLFTVSEASALVEWCAQLRIGSMTSSSPICHMYHGAAAGKAIIVPLLARLTEC